MLVHHHADDLEHEAEHTDAEPEPLTDEEVLAALPGLEAFVEGD